ncbi:MAG: hypothetical protein DME13_10435 [Candidatus Rokuibacteriota bacterium]|nr:MAG: hypothetical protein DME13_10435 [Candidatus Rokubacteria bacterium]
MDGENPACPLRLAANRASEPAHTLVMAGDDGVHAAPDARGAFLNGGAISLGEVELPRGEGLTPRLAAMLRGLARVTAEACAVDRCSIFVPKGDVLVPAMSQLATGAHRADLWQAFKALETKVGPEGPAILVEVLSGRRSRLVVTAPTDPRVPDEWKRFGIRTMLFVPLVRDDAVVGLRSRLRASETILSVGRTIGSTLELQEVVRRITREAAHAVRADSAGIYLMTETRDRMLPYAAYHMPKEILDTIRKRPILLKHFSDLQTHWSTDVPNDPSFQAPIFRQFPAKSLILAPLRAKDGVIGVLACAWWTRRHRVSREEISLMESLAGPAAVAIENARLYAKAAHAAVAQERVRVDKILHDTLRQTVFAMALKIEMALMGDARTKASALRTALRSVKQDASLMMAQMREVLPPGEVGGAGRVMRRRSRARA